MSRIVAAAAAVAVVAALVWFLIHRQDRSPLTLQSSALSSWTVVISDGTDPWIVGARPAEALTSRLFADASRRAGRPLVRPAHQAVPLVLQSEFADSLQGAYGADSVVGIARDAGVESAMFQPVCLAMQEIEGASGAVDMYFVPFESPAFFQMRADLTPFEPEHAGIGVYDPAFLTPVLLVGATADAFDRALPIRFDRERDCLATITIEN